jgi:predicted DNA-binding transcriptional regulator YafY
MMTRIELIHEAVRHVRPDRLRPVTRESLARELEVSVATVKRDMELLKEFFEAPLQFDYGRGTYYYTEPFALRPPIHLERSEALAVISAIRIAAGTRLFPAGRNLVRAFAKIAPVLGGVASLEPAALASVFSMAALPASETEGRHFALLFEAILERRAVKLLYRKPRPDTAPEWRTVHPLHIVVRADGCTLIAHDPESNDRRNLELGRIQAAETAGSTFAAPKNFNLKRYLAGGFDRFLGEPRHEVRIAYDAGYVPYVREQAWHAGRPFTPRADGWFEAVYAVNDLRDVEHRILAAGGQAEAISPPELRDRIRALTAKLMERHAE